MGGQGETQTMSEEKLIKSRISGLFVLCTQCFCPVLYTHNLTCTEKGEQPSLIARKCIAFVVPKAALPRWKLFSRL